VSWLDTQTFALASAVLWLATVVAALALRSRAYALFRGVLLGIHCLLVTALWPRAGALQPVVLYLHVATFLQSIALVRPRMRSLPWRLLVSVPSAFFQAGTMLLLPWALLFAAGIEAPGWQAAYVLALVGMVQSLASRREVRDLVVADGGESDGVCRSAPGALRVERPLRLVQISDPHLGPFMSTERLRRICERAVEHDPDLVLLTGDFLTMESQGDPELLGRSLAPLRPLAGRTFACLGNHDHEAPRTVRAALESAGVRLLVDQAAVVETPAGHVQVVGADFRWRNRAEHLAEVCARHPRIAGSLRLVLLHDPGAFRLLPEGEADLVLSGHTHGGQLGLVSLGLDWTVLRWFAPRVPDHGFWARGRDRLYVHRGTGHYGFPLRLGVPAEESLVRVHFEPAV
jgi:predicted MPP superfamily phosphohydrolase